MAADVHLVTGLNGSGKTTFAKHLQRTLPGVRFSLDEWMLRLHGLDFKDPGYADVADSCRDVLWDIAAQVLRTDVDVILDWNMWSRERRADAVRRATSLGSRCQLHYLGVPLDVAIERVERREDPAAHRLDAAGIHHLNTLPEPPEESEGLTIHFHGQSDLHRLYRGSPAGPS